ncbi:MAG: hypothetical protein P1U88_16425 [Thalassobaculaceae bacterium]|nr:hypothetical protein [Thalassobaculaceae bacterium]
MRIRSIAIVAATALVTLCALPPALLGGAILAQTYAPDSLRFVVHAATGLAHEGMQSPEVQTAMSSVRNTIDWSPVKTAIADDTVASAADPARAR